MTKMVLQPFLDQVDLTDVIESTVATEQFLAFDFKSVVETHKLIFPLTGHVTTSPEMVEIFRRIEWCDYYGDEYQEQGSRERSIHFIQFLLPAIAELLPANLKTDQEPFNLADFLFSKTLGLDDIPPHHLMIALEVQEIISANRDIYDKRDRLIESIQDIENMLFCVCKHFTPKAMLLDALDHITDWANYFMDTAGCYQDGNLDLNLAALNSLKRKWGMK